MVNEEKVNKAVDEIKKAIDPDEIYLFGSYVSGQTKENSDIDICVIKDGFKDKHQMLLKTKKSLFNIGMPIDLLLFTRENFARRRNVWGSVQYEIFHKGRKVYGR